MKSDFLKRVVWLLSTSIVLLFVFYSYKPVISISDTESSTSDRIVEIDITKDESSSYILENEVQEFIYRISSELIQRHKNDIDDIHVQLSLGDLLKFIMEQYPKNGMGIFTTILESAFPNHVHDILEIVAKMDQYNQWHADNLLSLNEMNELERNGAIWNKRREIFGDLADIIWQNERNQEDAKRLAVQETVDALHQAKDLGLQERLQVLQSTIYEQFGDSNTNFLINKGMVANIYFHLESVQEDLHGMSDSERAEAIAQARRQLGFTEADINYMAEQDAKKESRWKNGYAYMAERDQLSASYSGETLEQKLDDLREKYFGREAPTIKKEEASGFNRYERPRMYGRN